MTARTVSTSWRQASVIAASAFFNGRSILLEPTSTGILKPCCVGQKMARKGYYDALRNAALDISIVIPVFNNEKTLVELIDRLHTILCSLQAESEVILVDDGSRDLSWSMIKAFSAKHRYVKGLRLSRNFGQHPAIAAGFRVASGRQIVLMDADLEDRPESLPMMIEALRPPIDIVYSISKLPEGHRPRLTSGIFHRVFSMAVRANVPPNIGTLRVFTAKVRDAILMYKEYNVLYGPLMFFLGFDSAFVTVERFVSKEPSRYNLLKRLYLARSTLISYTNIPSSFFLIAGLLTFAGVGVYSAIILVDYFIFKPDSPPGLVLLALLILANISISMAAFGVLGTYVFQVYQEVLARPRFHIREETGMDWHRQFIKDDG